MKEVFRKDAFPTAPGGNIYHWQEADTAFDVSEDGYYIVAIIASAKNAAQKKSTDDDDLRAAIDDYEFGKHEAHQAKISWRGFGTAASWDGASLKGGKKTVYFFIALEKGNHVIKFWADEKPAIHEIAVAQIEESKGAIEDVIFDFHETAAGTPTDKKGMPWKAFVFAPGFPVVKLVEIAASCQSAKQKGGTDGDNIKVYANGQIIQSPQALTSDKYKNFLFSGDLSEGKTEALMISGKEFLINHTDASLELWYDAEPVLKRLKFELLGTAQYDQGNTFWRRVGHVMEIRGLPFDFQNLRVLGDAYLQVSIARTTALRYAELHGFTFVDDAGVTRRIVEDNEPDALRHFVWSVLLTRAFNEEAANIITTNHEIFMMEITNKQELSRSGVQDIWNNKQGRGYAVQHPSMDHLELFKKAKSDGVLIFDLEGVKVEHREYAKQAINDMKDDT